MADQVTVASELFDLFAKQQSAVRDYFDEAQIVLERLRLDLLSVLGLPETYPSFGGDGEEPWAVLYKWDPESHAVERAANRFEVDTMSLNGELNAAIGIALSHRMDTYPKTVFWLPIKIRLTQENIFVALCVEPSQTFTFDRTATDFPQFSRAFVNVIETSLRPSPFDEPSRVFSVSRGIGFT